MERMIFKRMIILGITVLFLSASVIPGFSMRTTDQRTTTSPPVIAPGESGQGMSAISLFTFGRTNQQRHDVQMPTDTAAMVYDVFQDLRTELAAHPFSDHTQELKAQFIGVLADNDLLPATIPVDRYDTLLNPPWLKTLKAHYEASTSSKTGAGSNFAAAFMCSMSGTGIGVLFPFIMIPRPRIIATWAALDGSTIVGKLMIPGGFVAAGAHFGTAVGFWGVGLAFAYPYGNVYGFIGYALFASVTGEYVEQYPLNNAPVIVGTDPGNNAQNVTVSLKELSFSIEDPDGDLMSYNVTTTPDIGGASGKLKTAGTYTVPVSGFQSSTQYIWHVGVSDGSDTTEKDYSFTTEMLAPVISDPYPVDHARYVPLTLSNLSFTLMDYQGDLIDWSVETSPDVGAGSLTGVASGRFSVPIGNLTAMTTFVWFLNTTDGTYWNRRVFTFTTAAEGQIGLLPTDDITIMENHPTDHNYDSVNINTRSLSGWEWDILMQFDLSQVPVNATIEYASLQLYYFKNWDGNPGGDLVNGYRITSGWDELSATWSNQPTYSEVASTASHVPSDIGSWMEWDVTADVQSFLSGAYVNHGWRLVDMDGSNDIAYFWSKEASELQPVLLIGYDT